MDSRQKSESYLSFDYKTMQSLKWPIALTFMRKVNKDPAAIQKIRAFATFDVASLEKLGA
jgi:hypothetical protein